MAGIRPGASSHSTIIDCGRGEILHPLSRICSVVPTNLRDGKRVRESERAIPGTVVADEPVEFEE